LKDQFMLADVGHIVVVDDDPSLRQMVIRYLEDHNIPTRPASNRTELNRHLAGAIPSLIILDLRLGQEDGLDMLREIRSHSDVPVIITTGHRPDEIDRIVGLELGADDYIVKPFSLRELLARVRAVLRRQEMGRVARAHEPERGGYRFGGWKLERRGRRLLDANASPVALSKGEYALRLASRITGTEPGAPVRLEHASGALPNRDQVTDPQHYLATYLAHLPASPRARSHSLTPLHLDARHWYLTADPVALGVAIGEKVRRLVSKLRLPTTLKELGVKESDLSTLADECIKLYHRPNSPVLFDEKSMAHFYRMMWDGDLAPRRE